MCSILETTETCTIKKDSEQHLGAQLLLGESSQLVVNANYLDNSPPPHR